MPTIAAVNFTTLDSDSLIDETKKILDKENPWTVEADVLYRLAKASRSNGNSPTRGESWRFGNARMWSAPMAMGNYAHQAACHMYV